MSINPLVVKMQALLDVAETAPDDQRAALLDAIAGMSEEEILALVNGEEPAAPEPSRYVKPDHIGHLHGDDGRFVAGAKKSEEEGKGRHGAREEDAPDESEPRPADPLAAIRAAVAACTDDELDGLYVWVNAGHAVIDAMDWHEGEGARKIGAVAEKVLGKDNVHYQNEGPKLEGESWTELVREVLDARAEPIQHVREDEPSLFDAPPEPEQYARKKEEPGVAFLKAFGFSDEEAHAAIEEAKADLKPPGAPSPGAPGDMTHSENPLIAKKSANRERIGPYTVRLIDAEAMRNASLDEEEFGAVAIWDDFKIIPPNDIWVSDAVPEAERRFLIDGALARLKALSSGASSEDAYDRGLEEERKERERADLVSGKRARKRKGDVPEGIKVQLWKVVDSP